MKHDERRMYVAKLSNGAEAIAGEKSDAEAITMAKEWAYARDWNGATQLELTVSRDGIDGPVIHKGTLTK